ncbi:glycosyltransferase [Rhizobium sp. G21]|uniref:glycosyltransferase n=1 Tax=Rhizobium sp. G21 TaxID=2758439 RepID=UPI0016031EF0|nr:glycosyltransferase [Rhizobium sp. G21]MBB1247572.1 glycosyltransferase [Rhizobium sp. G21]
MSKLYQNRFLRKAAGFHLLTDKEGGDVAEFVTGQPSRIIRNFAQAFASDGQPPSWMKPEYEGRKVYLFLGRIHEKKGCMELMQAWEKLSLDNPDFARSSLLVFCGWNDGIEGFERRAGELNRKFGNVLFAGPQYGHDKARSMASARYFLLPSKSEGLPMAVLEAWAAGVPCILTPECNLAIGFERGAAYRTGFTPETIYPALQAAHALPDTDWDAASERSKALAAEEFSEESVRNGLLDLYQAAIDWKRVKR